MDEHGSRQLVVLLSSTMRLLSSTNAQYVQLVCEVVSWEPDEFRGQRQGADAQGGGRQPRPSASRSMM